MDSKKNEDIENDEDSNSLITPDKSKVNKIFENIQKYSNNINYNFVIFKSLTILICLFIIISDFPKHKQMINNEICAPSDNNVLNDNSKTDDINKESNLSQKETDINQIETDINQIESDKSKDDNENKNINEIDNNKNNITNNKGFIKINTYHKGKYDYYNFTDNIKVYKDIYKDIKYKTIDESNTIIPSHQYSNDDYFKLCESKKLLDETKYKRNKNPKISVIIAYFNRNKFSLYIPLRSIQNQSFKDVEIIFVDDGSTQNKIDEIIEEMKNDNRIILIVHKNNKGTLMTRVDGVRFASGEYIILLDQDDLYYDNLVFEKLYNKAKELNADLVQFATLQYRSSQKNNILGISTPKNILVTQPELRTAFLNRLGENRLGNCATRMVWDKFIRREVYLEAIDDLGDEYLNHRVFLYEDTIMMFELSQIAYSYYFYDIIGYRLNVYLQGRSRGPSEQNIQILAMNQLLFIKLLLYKIDPKFDRYHIFKEWGFSKCPSEVMYLSRNDIDLLQEVIEVIDGLEKKYKNTAKELLECVTKIKKRFGIS